MLTCTCMQILCGSRVMSMFTKYHGETDSRSADRKVVQFFVCGNLCRLLTDIFANSLEPVQDRRNVGSDLDPNRLKF